MLDEQQEHLFQHWPAPGTDDDRKRRFVAQVSALDQTYPGGLRKYIQNARSLLESSRKGENAFEGCRAAVPEGKTLSIDRDQKAHETYEQKGLHAAARTAFVLVAGGLGERLGYDGIKVRPQIQAALHRALNMRARLALLHAVLHVWR